MSDRFIEMNNVSLRTKILLFMTLIPLLALGLYFGLAIRIFEDDKVAYVFDSNSSVAQSLAAQTTSEINSMIFSTRPVLQDFLKTLSFGEISKNWIENETRADWIAVYKKPAIGGMVGVASLEKSTGSQMRSELSKWPRFGKILNEIGPGERAFDFPFDDSRIAIFEAIVSPETKEKFVFVIMANFQTLVQNFKSIAGVQIYFVTDGPHVLLSNSDGKPEFIDENLILKLKNLQFPLFTQEVIDQSKLVQLVSAVKTIFPKYYVISAIEKRKALSAVDTLIRRSLIFLAILMAVTTLLSLVASGRVTASLRGLSQAADTVSQGKFDIRVEIKSNDEIGKLAKSFNSMASEVSRLMMETASKARMESELKTAKIVQETLFPPNQADLGGIEVFGFYEPASECGGDWWHYSQSGDKTAFWIGDATGHGAPAALLTSAAKSASTIIERLDVDPAHAMELLNKSIFDVSKGRMMMTFFIASFDRKTCEFTFANASHEAPFLWKKTGSPLKKKDLIPLNEVNGKRTGQARDTQYENHTIKLDPGDRIFFFTDGLMDIASPEGVVWGERDFIKNLVESHKDNPSIDEGVSRLVNKMQTHRSGTELKDDVTFFEIHYYGERS